MTEPTDRPCIAIEFQPTPEKLTTILDFCVEHRPWYQDHTWVDKASRRQAASAVIASTFIYGKIWEVWRLNPATLCGILLLQDIDAKTDAQCHFVFFDRKLADKRELCISTMRWAFETLELHRLSVEIPTYARALAKFARKLGFRYEAENREPYAHKDERLEPLGLAKAYVGSRKFQAALYEGAWHDVLLLSITVGEFKQLHGGKKDEGNTDGAQTPTSNTAPKPESI